MERQEIRIEVRLGGVVRVDIKGVGPDLCKRYKDFFARILHTTDEEEFQRLEAPSEQTQENPLHHHTGGNG